MIQVSIVSQEQEIYNGQADFVSAPATMGEVGIMPGHSPFISTLKSGEIVIRHTEEERIFISGGFIEVQPTVVTILSDTAIRSRDLDEAKILETKKLAQKAMENAKTDIDIARAQSELSNATTKMELMSQLKDKLHKKGF